MLVPNKYLLMAAICKKLYTSFAENIKINQSHVLFEMEKSVGMQKRTEFFGNAKHWISIVDCVYVCVFIHILGFFLIWVMHSRKCESPVLLR